MTAAMNLLPMAAGVVVLGDPLPGSPPLFALRLAAFAAAAFGACLLAVAREQPAAVPEARGDPPAPVLAPFATAGS